MWLNKESSDIPIETMILDYVLSSSLAFCTVKLSSMLYDIRVGSKLLDINYSSVV